MKNLEKNGSYGIKLAIIYSIVWFVDLLDASLLNVALPAVSQYFTIDPINAEWALIGFLLAMVVGMLMSNPTRISFGSRLTFLTATWLYSISSLACGLASYFSELVLFRVIQGFSGGLMIPIGLQLLMNAMSQKKWVKTSSWINIFTLLAPALGPTLAGYIVTYLNWRWLFFAKLPLSVFCVILSHLWIKRSSPQKSTIFDWFGLIFGSLWLCLFLLVISEIGKTRFSENVLLILFALSIFFAVAFFWQQKHCQNPLVPLTLFRSKLFAWGNVIQSVANMIFLGATFLIALYLQWGVGFGIVQVGWMMAAISVGIISVMPITAKFYNKIGPLPYIVIGLLLMSSSMFSLIFITKQTPPLLIAFIIFCEGAGSAGLQTTNFASIFCEVPQKLRGAGSSLYALFKQISASLGIALSTMILTIAMNFQKIPTLTTNSPKEVFYPPLILLGGIPLLALLCCFFIDNNRALQYVRSQDHLETEIEEGIE